MKILTLSVIMLSSLHAIAQNINPKYDSTIAKALGANDMGMKLYVLGILREGNNTIEDKKAKDSLISAHIKHMTRLSLDGLLIAAGALGKNDKSYRGLFILNAATIEQANKLMENDPAITENIYMIEFFVWTASASLVESSKIHQKLVKYKPRLD